MPEPWGSVILGLVAKNLDVDDWQLKRTLVPPIYKKEDSQPLHLSTLAEMQVARPQEPHQTCPQPVRNLSSSHLGTLGTENISARAATSTASLRCGQVADRLGTGCNRVFSPKPAETLNTGQVDRLPPSHFLYGRTNENGTPDNQLPRPASSEPKSPLVLRDGPFMWRFYAGEIPTSPQPDTAALLDRVRRGGVVLIGDGLELHVVERWEGQLHLQTMQALKDNAGAAIAVLRGEHRERVARLPAEQVAVWDRRRSSTQAEFDTSRRS
jgi:hypothetical protein